MTAEQYATLSVAAALTLTVCTIALTATWRRTLKPWWQRCTWTPRLTPGALAECIGVMGEDGRVGWQIEKLRQEDNASEIFARFTEEWFALGESMGISMNYTSKIGAVIDTPDGPEYMVALMRPKAPKVRAMTEREEDIAAP